MYENALQVRDLYLERKTVTEICNLTKLHQSTVRKYLKKFNIYDSKRDKSSDQDLIKYATDLYSNNEQISSICKKVNRCDVVVRGWLKDSKIYNPRQYNFAEYTNLDFFHEIDTEEKVYWLGFIYADGYVSIHQNQKR